MRDLIGKYENTIDKLRLENRTLTCNTLILGQEGSGKTNLACRIRNYAIDNGVATLYLDFSNSDEAWVELRYKDEFFNYIKFEESAEFDEKFAALVAERKHIYMAADPSFFSNKRDIKSRLTQTLQLQGLLDNYYYFFHDIENLNGFYTKFEDFLLYMLTFLNLKKYGLTFLAQPHSTFENSQLKLLFTFLFVGKCSNFEYFNTADLKKLPKNKFLYQYRTNFKTILFSDIKSHVVEIDEYELGE